MMLNKMSRAKMLQKLNQLESEHSISDKPFIAFVGMLPDGKCEIVEHLKSGKSVKYETKVFDTTDDYFNTNPSWVVIVDDLEGMDDD